MSTVFVYNPESVPSASAAIGRILCSHLAHLLNKAAPARCCRATEARRWASEDPDGRPLAKLLQRGLPSLQRGEDYLGKVRLGIKLKRPFTNQLYLLPTLTFR